MKKIYFLLLGLVLCLYANAQVINFPDLNFKGKLLEANEFNGIAKNLSDNYFKIDSNNDGQIQVTEALQVTSLYIPGSSIQNLIGIENFTNLNFLNVAGNQLTSLNINNLTNLSFLYFGDNSISNPDLSGLVSLTTLDCGSNPIMTLDLTSLNNLTSVICGNASINTLTLNGCTNLQELSCGSNSITTINLTGLTNLVYVNLFNNELTELNVNNLANLEFLSCEENQVTSLNLDGCVSLETLYCRDNMLANLDLSGFSNLNIVDCSYNQLNYLNVDGCINLSSLNARNNQLATLDLNSCVALNSFNVMNNQIVSLFLKNDSYQLLQYFGGNPLLYICCDENELTDYSSINEYYPNIQINTYCSFVPGGTYYTVEGNSKMDLDNSGCTNSNTYYPNLKINIMQNSNLVGIHYTNQDSFYSIPFQSGTRTIIPILENPTYFNISPASFSVTFPGISPFLQDFCITPNGIHNDLEVTILPLLPARPGFDATYRLVYKNKGNTTLSGSITFEFEDDKMDLITSIPLYSSQSTGLLTYDYLNLIPFETREVLLTMNINSPQETPAVNIDDQLNFTAIINPLSEDEYLFDNNSSLKQIVVGSYDPNDKTCVEGTVVGPEMIGQYVHYVIRFENTGTFPAENIVVKDMIDLTKFDLSTLIPTSSSHSFVTRIATDGKVEFIFENIQLPFDDANNDGYIAFKIKTLPSLAVGDTFSNNANIYFDYNFPIETNTATTSIQALGNSDFDLSDYVTLYPNPVKNELNVSVKEMISITSINIYNSLGQLVLASTNPEGSVDVSSLKSGNYFIKLISDKGVTISQFIKE